MFLKSEKKLCWGVVPSQKRRTKSLCAEMLWRDLRSWKKVRKAPSRKVKSRQSFFWMIDGEAEERVNKCKRTNSFHLSLDKLSLCDVPKETICLYLSYLDLSRNNLTFLDNQLLLNNLNSLQALYLDFNSIFVLPAEIVFLKRLKVLSVNYNQLTELPTNLGQMESLKYLGVKGMRSIFLGNRC
jgi:hypothetical protein